MVTHNLVNRPRAHRPAADGSWGHPGVLRQAWGRKHPGQERTTLGDNEHTEHEGLIYDKHSPPGGLVLIGPTPHGSGPRAPTRWPRLWGHPQARPVPSLQDLLSWVPRGEDGPGWAAHRLWLQLLGGQLPTLLPPFWNRGRGLL